MRDWETDREERERDHAAAPIWVSTELLDRLVVAAGIVAHAEPFHHPLRLDPQDEVQTGCEKPNSV